MSKKIKLAHFNAAIIGYWRSGATHYEIAELLDIHWHAIKNIIHLYQKSLENTETE